MEEKNDGRRIKQKFLFLTRKIGIWNDFQAKYFFQIPQQTKIKTGV